MNDHVVQTQVAVNNGGGRRSRHVARQPFDQLVHGRLRCRLGGPVLAAPACGLARQKVARLTVVGQAHRRRVHAVQIGDHVVDIFVECGALLPRQFGQRGIPEHPALDEPHHVERGADDGAVLTQMKRGCDGHIRRLQGRDDAVFALHRMGRRQQDARGLFAKDILRAVAAVEPIGWIRLPTGEALDRQRSLETRQVSQQMAFERADVEVIHGAEPSGLVGL